MFCNTDSTASCLVLNPSKNVSHFFNEFNNFMLDPYKSPENLVNCKYYSPNINSSKYSSSSIIIIILTNILLLFSKKSTKNYEFCAF